ncbi:general stress protein [Methylorubrum extorquens]|uniref:general stress protein n=1 Tax=Methylorubrum extorquens TaxID=408 RepID=UPI00209CDE70|nr:KGG domain-containing protein [Methylorubrum extorquens]MCP1539987.1 general stress protein YciG [Methylorubrum extorquens]
MSDQNTDTAEKPKKESRIHMRGFASLSPERRKEIASKGGRSIPAESRAFSKNPELARAAGRKGGSVAKKQA